MGRKVFRIILHKLENIQKTFALLMPLSLSLNKTFALISHPSSLQPPYSFPEKDVLLWQQVREGNKPAFGSIYSNYFAKLYGYGLRITKDTGIVEDSIQDVFVELWNGRSNLSEVRNVKAYLFKCVRSRVLYKLEKSHSKSEVDFFDIELSHKSHFLNNQIAADIRQRLTALIKTLTPKQKEAIYLIYFDELGYEETADVMGVKVKTVYNLVHLAISKLKENRQDLTFFSFLL